MRRLRILFVVFSLTLLAPMAFLVQRALSSVASERTMRHQVVAERIFDEMERGLSRLLDVEESRPLEQGEDEAPPSQFPFVIGHFQIDPGGGIRVLSVQPERTDGHDEVTRSVSASFSGGRVAAREQQPAASQLPGTTMNVAPAAKDRRATEQAELERRLYAVEPQQGVDSAFDALRSLNKGAEERAARQRKAAESAESDDYVERKAFADRGASISGLVDAPSAGLAAPRKEKLDAARDEVELPPLQGRTVDAGHFVLYRTVVLDGRAYRQGAVVDPLRLGEWLRDQALSDGLAQYADVVFDGPFGTSSDASGDTAFLYRHRFAEPFDDLSASLTLRPLPGVGSVGYVYALSALLLAVGSLGLAALYRMVAVTVGFAERKSNFVAAVTHELKTPLTAIRMYGEMLRDGMVPSEPKRDEYYRHITQESERLSRLINNVLEFSRLEKGNREVTLAPGAVAPVVREVADILRPHVEGQGFTLRVDADGDLPPARFERDALVQVLCNLVDNAVKYSGDAAKKEIVLRCRNDDGHVAVAVLDHGPGVAARHIGKIFEPFYRGESELTRRSKGVGLGLALVRGWAERMGAKVSGRNAPGGGFEVEMVFE
jgi:signal transduction histidine kinase